MDFENVSFCQLRSTVLRACTIPDVGLAAKDAEGMKVVFRGSDNLKVCEGVVASDAVDVVNLEARRDAFDKRLPHQSVSLDKARGAAVAKSVADITSPSNAGLKDKAGAGMRTSFDPLYSPKVGNLINTLILEGRRPNLIHQ